MNKNKVLSEAFTWLFYGLILCFGVSFLATFNNSILKLVYFSFGGMSYFIWLIAEIVVALVLTVRIRKLKPTTAKILYLAYALLTGISLTGIFIVYTTSSLTYVFLATAVIFGIFALIGKNSKIDLSKWWIYLFIALLAIIILEIINIFLLNNTLNILICIASIIVFSIYIAYDISRALDENYLSECENKGVFIAFQLFIDIINVFLDLLRLLGKARDN